MLVTLDPQEGALQIQRLNSVLEGREESMQLWALPAGGKPQSLGECGLYTLCLLYTILHRRDTRALEHEIGARTAKQGTEIARVRRLLFIERMTIL